MFAFIARYRRRRAIRLAHRGVALLAGALRSPDITRAERRRIMSDIAHGKLDARVVIGDGE